LFYLGNSFDQLCSTLVTPSNSTGLYKWQAGNLAHELRLVPVAGTQGTPYLFGAEPNRRPIAIPDFAIMITPVTQGLWSHVMGQNPAERDEPFHPVTNVSWERVTGPDGFLQRINASPIRTAVAGGDEGLFFRLPSETEWEYAARGGPHWRDGFAFSGSNNIDEVAWYGSKFSRSRRLVCRLLGWRIGWRWAGRFRRRRPTHTHPVAAKAPNQLGLYDMCGNVWEWCQDRCCEIDSVPRDGSPCEVGSAERRLRGGCHHNWDIHCTVWFRYGIAPDSRDGCIGFRLVLARSRAF
jgi:sulfatase modifying factor 1